MIPPIWVTVQVSGFWIPLPVFLLWPVFVLSWLVFGLALTVLLLLTGGRINRIGGLWLESWRLLCALRGTRVDTRDARTRVRISIV